MWKLSERSHRWLKWKATPMNSQHKCDKYKKMHHGVTDLIDSCAAQYSGGIIFTDIEYFHFLESTASSNLNPYNPETDDRGMVSYTNWVFLLYCDSKWNMFFYWSFLPRRWATASLCFFFNCAFLTCTSKTAASRKYNTNMRKESTNRGAHKKREIKIPRWSK